MCAYICANSSAKARPPTTSIDSGLSLRLRASTFVTYSTLSIPWIGSMRGDDPVAIMNFPPSMLIPSTLTCLFETNLAFPRKSLADGSDLRTSEYFSFPESSNYLVLLLHDFLELDSCPAGLYPGKVAVTIVVSQLPRSKEVLAGNTANVNACAPYGTAFHHSDLRPMVGGLEGGGERCGAGPENY